MKVEIFKCDSCKKVTENPADWYLVTQGDDESFLVNIWDEESAEEVDYHLCGRECVHKLLDKWFGQ